MTRQARLERYGQVRARVRKSPRASMAAFEALVAEAMDSLPADVRAKVENVAVVVEERPSPGRLAQMGYGPRQDLLGLYEGIARPHRGMGYNMVAPDRITLYRQPLLAQAGSSPEALVREIRKTMVHEVAHHFGYGDPELERLEREREAEHRA